MLLMALTVPKRENSSSSLSVAPEYGASNVGVVLKQGLPEGAEPPLPEQTMVLKLGALLVTRLMFPVSTICGSTFVSAGT